MADDAPLRRISRIASRRSDSLEAYSAALRRLSQLSTQHCAELEAGVPTHPAMLQALDDARVIWTAARRVYMKSRLL